MTVDDNLLLSTAKPALAQKLNWLNSSNNRLREYIDDGKRKDIYAVRLFLANKFESEGYLVLILDGSVIKDSINKRFFRLILVVPAVLLATAILWLLFQKIWPGRQSLVLNLVYSLAFMAMSVVVVYNLVQIYNEGILAKSEALANSLARRLAAPLELGLHLDDLQGVDQAINNYKAKNPDISHIVLRDKDVTRIHTDPSRIGKHWNVPKNHHIVRRKISAKPDAVLWLDLIVLTPKSIVYAKLWKSIKNFIILFFASVILSRLFLKLLSTLQWRFAARHRTPVEIERIQDPTLMFPFQTLAIFVEGLCLSFMPVYLGEILARSGAGLEQVSWIFFAYFAGFSVVLIPGGWYSERFGYRNLIVGGMGLAAAGLIGLPFAVDLLSLTCMRVISGVGQGMILIGAESYILRHRKADTSGTSIIVLGYNMGMISGTALGALLVTYTNSETVIFIAAAIGFINMFYAGWLVIDTRQQPKAGGTVLKSPESVKTQSRVRRMAVFLSNLDLVQTIMLIGIPTKAVFSGVILFALPLLLNDLGFSRDEIGQMLIFYAAGVLCTTYALDRVLTFLKRTTYALFLGAIGGAAGLLLIGLAGSKFISELQMPILRSVMPATGIFMMGLFHGLIHAPIVSHVISLPVSKNLGRDFTSSTYRFLERSGHPLGPIIVGLLMTVSHSNPDLLLVVGCAAASMGLIFLVISLPTKRRTLHERPSAGIRD